MLQFRFLLLAGFLLWGCGAQKSSTAFSAEKLDKTIERKLGEKATRENNFENTYTLAWTNDNQSGTPIIRYGVWVISTGELLYAGTAVRGKVTWLDNTSLLVEDYPGIVDGDQQQFKYKIDLTTKIKTPIHEKEDL